MLPRRVETEMLPPERVGAKPPVEVREMSLSSEVSLMESKPVAVMEPLSEIVMGAELLLTVMEVPAREELLDREREVAVI